MEVWEQEIRLSMNSRHSWPPGWLSETEQAGVVCSTYHFVGPVYRINPCCPQKEQEMFLSLYICDRCRLVETTTKDETRR